MKTTYTRFMAFCAFFYALYYITISEAIDGNVLLFLGSIIAIWALGRATIIEALKVWKGDA